MDLSLDINSVFFPQGSSAKSTCIANTDGAAVNVTLTETADPFSPQRQDEFRSVSTETNQNPDIQQIQDPSTAAGGGTSNNTLTQEEILSMKQQNPIETLRKLQILRQASTEVHPYSLTSMPIPEMDASVTLKLQQLKTYLFEHEVLAIIEEEEALGIDILVRPQF